MTSYKVSVSNFCRTVPLVCCDHKHEILQALYQQQQAGILCDIYIVIEQEKVPAHKAVLAASSKYFSALFETGQETDVARSNAGNVREIVLSSVPRSTFFPILHFMYTSALHVFRENVHDILNTAKKLQITSIIKICTKITEDGVVLPSLKDLDNSGNQGNDYGSGKKNDVLYLDLGLCNNVQETLSVQSSSQYNEYSRHVSPSSGCISEAVTQDVEHQPLVQSSSISNSLEAPTMLTEISVSNSFLSDTANINSSTSETQNRPAGFPCSQCPKSFKKKANLKRHVLIKHSSLHKFVCPKCGKRYAIEQSLQYHISTSKCSKKVSLQYQSPASIIQPSVADSQLSVLVNSTDSGVMNVSGYLSNETMIESGIETLGDSSILQQSLVSTNPGDSLSLVIPPTTLFPSLANIHEESLSSNFNHLDALNNIAAEHSISSSSNLEPKETFLCSSSNFPSDEDSDMPTIKSIQSIKTISAYPDAEVEIDHGRTFPESNGDSSETFEASVNSSAADTTSTPRDCMEIGNEDGAPKLIRIAPKTPLMMPLRRQQKHKLSAGREKVPVVVRSPINISTCLNLNSNSDISEHTTLYEVAPACSSESRTEGSPKASRDGTELHIVGKCMVCGRAFHSTDSLIYHKRKCCKCPFCNRVFSQFSNMKRHVGIFHTNLKPHECSICGRAYGIKQSLRFHMEAKHGIPSVTRKYNRNAARLGKDTSQTTS